MADVQAVPRERIPMWAWLALGAVVLFLFLRSGFLSSLMGLGKTAADTVNSAIKTTRRVAADFDPFNHRGRAAAVLRAVDVSKPVKKIGRAIDPSKGVKKLGKKLRKLF